VWGGWEHNHGGTLEEANWQQCRTGSLGLWGNLHLGPLPRNLPCALAFLEVDVVTIPFSCVLSLGC
jgi:hypothetical protein